jgi:hypothetical protein
VLLVRLHAQYRVGYQQSSHTVGPVNQLLELEDLHVKCEYTNGTYLCPQRTILAFPTPPA